MDLGLSAWDQIFPNPVEDHCFQQIFSDDGETFDDETNVNVDFQFTTDSTEAGVKYMTFIALNSCIQNFVSSDGVVFTADSITVTDDEGDSITLTEDSMTMADADGGSIVITDDAVTISGADDDAGLVIENADVTSTDDGGMVIENDDIELVVTESGDFVATTDDSVTYGDGVVYVSFGEDSATFGMTNTEESFTIPGTVGGTTSLVFRPDTGGSIKWTDDDMVYVEGVDLETGEATFTGISDPVYNYTIDEESGEGYFTISGSTEECDDFVVGFNAETVYVGSEDCGFTFGMNEDGASLITDDSATFGNEDSFITFTEDSATFGSSVSGESFTIMGTPEETDDSLVFSPDTGGSIEFKEDETVVVEGVDLETGDATFTTISDPVYNYTIDEDTGDGFYTITGSIEECDDFQVGFNAETVYVGSEDCGFTFGMNEDGASLITDDSATFGNEDSFITFTEDSATFGSTESGESFTLMGVVTGTDEDSILFEPETGGSAEFSEE